MTNKDCFYILMLFVVLGVGLECGYKIGRSSTTCIEKGQKYTRYHGVNSQMEYHRIK